MKKFLMLSLKSTGTSVNTPFFSATLENSGYDSHCLMVPDQTSEAEWIAGPNMNWVTT